jgi:hypothetical protein
VLLQPDQRSPAAPTTLVEPASISKVEHDAVQDMAFFFQIPNHEARMLFQIGCALGKSAPEQQAERGAAPV